MLEEYNKYYFNFFHILEAVAFMWLNLGLCLNNLRHTRIDFNYYSIVKCYNH